MTNLQQPEGLVILKLLLMYFFLVPIRILFFMILTALIEVVKCRPFDGAARVETVCASQNKINQS